MKDKYKAVLYAAWSLRNQFNGAWDDFYFPSLAKALDKAFPATRYPRKLSPRALARKKK